MSIEAKIPAPRDLFLVGIATRIPHAATFTYCPRRIRLGPTHSSQVAS